MISVLMSLYKNENPAWFLKAFESITSAQERMPDEVVLVIDGPIGEELEGAVSDVTSAKGTFDPDSVNVLRLAENSGLGLALNAGLEKCRGDLIARMDTDDIALPGRLKLQEEFMNTHPDISACGTDIAEFETEGEILRIKHMPSSPEEVYKYGKKRNPLNHMTVMFRKEAVREAGSYQHFPLLEDYHLWSRMLSSGQRIANIPGVQVNARIGSTFAQRRGGKTYYEWYKQLRHLQKEWGYLNTSEYIISLALTFAMTRQSSASRERAYKLLRR